MTAVEAFKGAAAPLEKPTATSTPPAEPVATAKPEGDEEEDDDEDETPAAGTGAPEPLYCILALVLTLLYRPTDKKKSEKRLLDVLSSERVKLTSGSLAAQRRRRSPKSPRRL
jgi:hypothetical protein